MVGALLNYGYLGVDFFFVLSGFIIYVSSQRKTVREYSFARLRRVYIPYLPIGIGIALLYTLLPSLSGGVRTWSWLTTLTLLPLKEETALSVAWTLKHEMLFYFVFAILFFNRLLGIGLAVWCVAIVVAATVGVGGIPLALINLEFVAGILAAIACARGINSRWLYVPAAFALIGWIALGADRTLSPWLGFAIALAIPPTVALERAGRIRVPGWLLLLGAASYAMYLAHGLAISIAGRLLHNFRGSVILAAGVAAGIAAGLLYYWVVETPLLRWFGRSLKAGRSCGHPAHCSGELNRPADCLLGKQAKLILGRRRAGLETSLRKKL